MAETSKKNMLLLSGSKASGNLPEGAKAGYLEFAEGWIKEHFAEAIAEKKPVMFVPYARPSGMTEADYFTMVHDRLAEMGIETVCAPPQGITPESLEGIGGIYVGGGHTYTLLHKLQQNGGLDLIRDKVEEGLPYLGSSAGTIITCPTIKTTNDMPGPAHDVVDLKSFGLIGAQLNCHYMDDAMHDPKHHGETRDTRIKEFCAFNPNTPVIGLYEGQALKVDGNKTHLLTSERTRGLNTPVFMNDRRDELACEIGVEKDVSRLCEVRQGRSAGR